MSEGSDIMHCILAIPKTGFSIADIPVSNKFNKVSTVIKYLNKLGMLKREGDVISIRTRKRCAVYSVSKRVALAEYAEMIRMRNTVSAKYSELTPEVLAADALAAAMRLPVPKHI